MSRPRAVAGRLLALSALAVVLAGCRGAEPAKERPALEGQAAALPDEAPVTPEAATAELREPPGGPLTQLTVDVYFPSLFGDGLVSEPRQIFDTATPGDRVKQIVADLIAGPQGQNVLPALPRTVTLRQAYVLDNGVVYLDFSPALTDGMGGGSMEELLLVYAVVNSVTLNVGGIERVGILINGRPVETLNGHLDLRHPLPPDRKLILGQSAARAGAAREEFA